MPEKGSSLDRIFAVRGGLLLAAKSDLVRHASRGLVLVYGEVH